MASLRVGSPSEEEFDEFPADTLMYDLEEMCDFYGPSLAERSRLVIESAYFEVMHPDSNPEAAAAFLDLDEAELRLVGEAMPEEEAAEEEQAASSSSNRAQKRRKTK
jgi:hypothetical protein